MLYVPHPGSVAGEGPSCLSPQHYHGLGHMFLLSHLHFLNDSLHQDALGQLTQGFRNKEQCSYFSRKHVGSVSVCPYSAVHGEEGGNRHREPSAKGSTNTD